MTAEANVRRNLSMNGIILVDADNADGSRLLTGKYMSLDCINLFSDCAMYNAKTLYTSAFQSIYLFISAT